MIDRATYLRRGFTSAWALMTVALAQTGVAQGQIAAQLEFEERCHLPQGEYLKRVLPPHPASRSRRR